jgi:hypothetical protein
MSVCLIFVHIHTVEYISTKFGMMLENLLGELLDTWKRALDEFRASLFPHYFLGKRTLGS